MSGDWANKFGYYDMCLREEYHYSSVMIRQNPMTFFYGFCHTNICEADDFNQPDAQEIIKDKLGSSIVSQMLPINLGSASYLFANPVTHYPDFSVGAYSAVIIIFILFCLGLIDPYKRLLDALTNSEIKKPKGIIGDFSLIENYKKLMNLKTIDPNLAIFNGVRAIAFMMVVYGHSSLLIIQATFQTELLVALQSQRAIITVDMLYSVDIFFWLGGFFMAFVMCETKRAKALGKNPASLFLVILHRLLRIWPCYIICIMINSYILPYLGGGPRWWSAMNYTDCAAGAFRNLLFIDNFFHDWDLCFGWGWYLTSDIQLFIICLIPMTCYALGYKRISKYLITGMIISSVIYGIVLCFQYDFLIPAKVTGNQDFYYTYYVNSLARAPPYFFGLLMGMLYREFKQKEENCFLGLLHEKAKDPKFRLLFQITCYLLGFGIISWLVFGWKSAYLSPDPTYWSYWFQHLYSALCRLTFVFGVACLCLPNMIGIYDIFNRKAMNNSIFKFTAKISFACYLIHYMVLLILNYTFYITPTYITQDVIQLFVGCTVITMVAGVFLTLLVEMPFGTLQVKIIDSITKPRKQKQQVLLEQ
ncbi:unnamed protein product (macronuclear) [Paramecium tetraurelia]|uniref:Acyltransferase 3 domain-containing protein n=1 Tax=Paramecium tetraurelia TaxID=5888 RepID=A0DGZ8_PARTE|nr:uncharacterized protein GSPATT00002444001 [Paramecium tetraurelia]CAK82315.1 unnamed protein product [Paramecium tetraurelia]|eukprot:XP_001449712.1 hypothetical protein (macronuclear) [Paramecium tetraurelia strain d4-2]